MGPQRDKSSKKPLPYGITECYLPPGGDDIADDDLLSDCCGLLCTASVGEGPAEAPVHSSRQEDEFSGGVGRPLQALESDASGLGR